MTAGQSWCLASLGAGDHMLHLSDNYFLYISCTAPSLTRGRVCNLQSNDTSSISGYIATDGQSSSSSWCLTPFGAGDQMLHLSDNYFLYISCTAPSLTRGRVCNLQCNDAKFNFKLRCDRRSVGQFVLVPGPQWGPITRV
jgi:hypothetical protein